jgi:hypothetical protein
MSGIRVVVVGYWFMVLTVVVVGGALVALLARRCLDGVDRTIGVFDDCRRDVRLAVVELRVEQDRIARRVQQLDRRRNGAGPE